MMKGEGLPEQNRRHAISGKFRPVTAAEREKAIDGVKRRFAEQYGDVADTVLAAESDGNFVCMAYRITP